MYPRIKDFSQRFILPKSEKIVILEANVLPEWIGDIVMCEDGSRVELEKLFLEHDRTYPKKCTTLPDSIGNFIHLKHFEIEFFDNLTCLPDSMEKMTQLEYFLIEQSKINIFPPVLLKLTSLKELYLCNEPLESIPSEISALHNLEKLSLSGFFPTLPDSIGTLKKLKTLYIMSCGQFISVPDSMAELTNLESLSLFCTGLTHMPYCIKKLPIKEMHADNSMLFEYDPMRGDFPNLEIITTDTQNRYLSLYTYIEEELSKYNGKKVTIHSFD